MLREYQEKAITDLSAYWSSHGGNPIIVMPTGTGKSHVIAEIVKRTHQAYGARFLMLTHVKELVEQNAKKLKEHWPSAPFGIYAAGLAKKEWDFPIVYGSIQSVSRNPHLFTNVDCIIVDECHLIPVDGEGMYLSTFKELRKYRPNLKIIGFTATDYRMRVGKLTESGNIFDYVVSDMSKRDWFSYFIGNNYLVAPISRRTLTQIDVSTVKLVGGEFALDELQKVSIHKDITVAAIKETLVYGQDRRSWIAFCSGIEHCELTVEILQQFKIRATCIHSKLDSAERDKRLLAFKRGDFRCIVGNNILTTGFDHPPIDLIVMLRATMSPGLWVQMIGRGMRPAPGKANCLVLDFAGNTRRLGPIDDPVIPKRKVPKDGDAPVKICDACDTYNHISAKFCVNCGHEFKFESKLENSSDSADILTNELPVVEVYDVNNLVFTRHVSRKTLKDMIKVTYVCGVRRFSEYLDFWDQKAFGGKSRDWLKQRCGPDIIIPDDIDKVIELLPLVKRPKQIRVWVNKKFPEILAHIF